MAGDNQQSQQKIPEPVSQGDNERKKNHRADGAIERRTGGGDLFIRLGFRGIQRRYNLAAGGADYLTATVEFIDIRRRKMVYRATVIVDSLRPFPHNWKATHFEGRLDNEVYNLAKFIARKF